MKPTKPIRLLMLDIDGVITDGTVMCAADGPEHKRYSFRDVDAVFEAKRNGIIVALVTGEDTDWVDSIAHRLEVDHLVKGAKNKLEAVSSLADALGIDLAEACYLGDSPRDAPAIGAVGLGLAPADAAPAAAAAAHQCLKARGGHGAVEEALRLILTRNAPSKDGVPGQFKAGSPNAIAHILAVAEASLGAQREAIDALAPQIDRAAGAIIEALDQDRTVIAFGNGGSASDAEHLVAELIGRFEIERPATAALSLTASASVITALGNDYGFTAVFDRQLRALGRPGDVVVAISTSGKSTNVIAALKGARELGLTAIGLTGGDGGELSGLVDVCLCVPSDSTARIQEAHRLIIHLICSLVEQRIATSADPSRDNDRQPGSTSHA